METITYCNGFYKCPRRKNVYFVIKDGDSPDTCLYKYRLSGKWWDKWHSNTRTALFDGTLVSPFKTYYDNYIKL